MEMNDFIADLETRAAQIEEAPSIDYADADFCAHCRKPLPRSRTEYRRVANKDYCHLCYEIRDVLSGRTHFTDAQREFEERLKRLNKLRSESDYLKD